MQPSAGNNPSTTSGIESGLLAIAQAVANKAAPVVDANGWTVYDFGSYKEYRKRVTFTFSAGTSVLPLSSTNLPVGVSSLNNVYLFYAYAVNGNAYDADIAFEGTSSNTTLNFTYQASTGQSGFVDVTLVTKS